MADLRNPKKEDFSIINVKPHTGKTDKVFIPYFKIIEGCAKATTHKITKLPKWIFENTLKRV